MKYIFIRYWKNNRKKEKKRKEEEIKKLCDQINKSSVINKDEIDLFMSWLEQKPKKIILLLDSKIDGDLTQTFYNKCSGKFPTVVFVKTTKGRRFGGYCSIGWENKNGGTLEDINNFIFSLDKKKNIKLKIPVEALRLTLVILLLEKVLIFIFIIIVLQILIIIMIIPEHMKQ